MFDEAWDAEKSYLKGEIILLAYTIRITFSELPLERDAMHTFRKVSVI